MDLINITSSALKEFRCAALDEGKELRIRIAMFGGGCSGVTVDMNFTKFPSDPDSDLVFFIGDIEFIVDEKSAALLRGATLDYGGGLLNRGFIWSFPNSNGGCGCGKSFAF
jgi:iron-sulfur cluster assembly protein